MTRAPSFGHFRVQDQVLGGRGEVGRADQFFSQFFVKLFSMDFPVVYDTTILNEHPFLVILGGARKGWGGSKCLTLSYWWVITAYRISYEGICLSGLAKKLNKWTDGHFPAPLRLRLFHSLLVLLSCILQYTGTV